MKSIVRGEDLSFFGQFVGSMLLENSLSLFWLESEFEKTRATPLPKRTKTKRAAVILVLLEWLPEFSIGRRVFLTIDRSY